MSNYIGRSWRGFSQIKNLVIFGDSYSSVGYSATCPNPVSDEPLGVPFPGDTYTEGFRTANWVGHLVSSSKREDHNLLVYDYAVGGASVPGVRHQVTREFLPHVGQKPEWAPWSETDTLFVTWVGINDCAFIFREKEITASLVKLFDLQHELYEAGARNFLFINLPPIDKSPALASRNSEHLIGDHTSYFIWNTHLREKVQEFSSEHKDITTMLYSAWSFFSDVLGSPSKYDFVEEEVHKAGGCIWMDHLHPTTKMHYHIAEDISKFLHNFPAYNSSVETK